MFKLGKRNKTKAKKKAKELKEGLDFYIENGAYVFTAHYLTERKNCCGNGCRHCPYNDHIK